MFKQNSKHVFCFHNANPQYIVWKLDNLNEVTGQKGFELSGDDCVTGGKAVVYIKAIILKSLTTAVISPSRYKCPKFSVTLGPNLFKLGSVPTHLCDILGNQKFLEKY